ncbi:MAG: 50S ribosomal protein L11 methyltransferase [Gammaproteobacteria bacterium]|nr:50S ribosomal protein L11 methyltransferase [Gammaproteobacteria bacterium]
MSDETTWLQLHIDTRSGDADMVNAALEENGALAVTLSDPADVPIYEPPLGEAPLWPDTRVTGLFPADGIDPDELVMRLQTALRALGPLQIRVETLADQDWERVWMRDFKPMRFGQSLWICPGDTPPPAPDANNILLDPGLAFGSGTHPTTGLCLEWLDEAWCAGGVLGDAEVIDYGCGSGILAVAAAKLGAHHVWAVDIDPQALTATTANAERNGVSDRITTCLPKGLPAMQADILIANILANPLKDLAPHFAALVRPGGKLVLSGILEDQIEPVWQAYRASFERDGFRIQGDWARIQGHKA